MNIVLIKMTLENIKADEFQRTRISHNGADEFFTTINVDRSDYKPTHISITHIEKPVTEEFSYHAELALSKRAVELGCEYATNLDYCQFNPDKGFMILVGTGWLRR